MNRRRLLTVLLLLPSSFAVVLGRPSPAAEYGFDFILDGYRRTLRDLNEITDPDDDQFEETLIPGPIPIGSGFLTFDDDEVFLPSLGNALDQTISQLSLLGPSTQLEFSINNPTEVGPEGIGPELLQAPVELSFEDSADGAELVGLNLSANDVVAEPGTFATIVFSSAGDTFSFSAVEGSDPPNASSAAVEGAGIVQFQPILRSQLPVGESQPRDIPEPATIVGSLIALAVAAGIGQKITP